MIAHLVLLLQFATHAVSQDVVDGLPGIPEVALLSDLSEFSSTASIRELLDLVSVKKGSGFRFGVAYDAGRDLVMDQVVAIALQTTFNHGVAENNCKWRTTEPEQDRFDMRPCQRSRDFFASYNATFRLHNTFWHEQMPKWLPGNFTSGSIDSIISNSVQHVAKEMNLSVSVDVLNEIVGDNSSIEMSASECVRNKMVWPTILTNSSVQGLSFVEAALTAARRGTFAKLLMNDYSIGGNNSKTMCYIKLASLLQSRHIPLDGIGLQSHLGAKWNNFDSKTVLKSTFSTFADMGLSVAITELDVWVQDLSLQSMRWQAAIYGDYLDACLYSPNCQEFVIWGVSDSVSWLNGRADRGASSPLLFDSLMVPKLSHHELVARLQRYIASTGEVCDTALGITQCSLININN